MELKKKIIGLLKEEGYQVNETTKQRVSHMLECIKDNNQFHKLDYVLDWVDKKRDECEMEVSEINLKDLKKWNIDPMTGNIHHDSGDFFSELDILFVA